MSLSIMKTMGVMTFAAFAAILVGCNSGNATTADGETVENPANGEYVVFDPQGDEAGKMVIDGNKLTIWEGGESEPAIDEVAAYIEVESYKSGVAKSVAFFDEKDRSQVAFRIKDDGTLTIPGQFGRYEPVE